MTHVAAIAGRTVPTGSQTIITRLGPTSRIEIDTSPNGSVSPSRACMRM